MDNISCCIVAVQKDEPYINHWVNYHINQGFSHIFIVDNNDIGNELSLNCKNKNKVSVLPANSIIDDHVSRIQYKLYNFVLDYIKSINSIKQLYTHVLCIDIDEYFWYANGNINDFIKNEMHDNTISLPWVCYDDNNIIYKKDLKYQNPIQNYTHIALNKWINTSLDFKTLAVINDNLTKLDIHYFNDNVRSYVINKDLAHIKHYRTQCVEEYIDKIMLRKCWNNQWWYEFGQKTIQVYFNYNEVTNEKLDAFQYFYDKYNLEMSESDKQFIKNNYIE